MSHWLKLSVAFLASWFGFGGCRTRVYTMQEQAIIRENSCNNFKPFNSQQRARSLRVSISQDFSHVQRVWIEKGFRLLEQLDFTFQIMEDPRDAELIVNKLAPNQPIIGFYSPRTMNLQIDGNRNAYEITGTTVHEFGHWLGMHHICVTYGERDAYGVPVSCSPVGYGRAAMNPTIRSTEQTSITRLDLLELRRVQRCQSLGF